MRERVKAKKSRHAGIRKRGTIGRQFYEVKFSVNGIEHIFGRYDTEREAAKAHDLYCLRKGIDRPLNVMRKV